MFDWILNTPLELHEQNKEKQAFLLIYANSGDSIKCKKKAYSKNMFKVKNEDAIETSLKLLCCLYC